MFSVKTNGKTTTAKTAATATTTLFAVACESAATASSSRGRGKVYEIFATDSLCKYAQNARCLLPVVKFPYFCRIFGIIRFH